MRLAAGDLQRGAASIAVFLSSHVTSRESPIPK
jgi:hypothetical protein